MPNVFAVKACFATCFLFVRLLPPIHCLKHAHLPNLKQGFDTWKAFFFNYEFYTIEACC